MGVKLGANLSGTLQQEPLGCNRLWIVVEQQKTHFFYFEIFFWNGPTFLQNEFFPKFKGKSWCPRRALIGERNEMWYGVV